MLSNNIPSYNLSFPQAVVTLQTLVTANFLLNAYCCHLRFNCSNKKRALIYSFLAAPF